MSSWYDIYTLSVILHACPRVGLLDLVLDLLLDLLDLRRRINKLPLYYVILYYMIILYSQDYNTKMYQHIYAADTISVLFLLKMHFHA